MNLSSNLASHALKHFLNSWASAGFVMYSGTQPATPETALGGNTALVTFALSFGEAAFQSSSGGFEAYRLSWSSVSVNASSTGTATFGRLKLGGVAAWGAGNDYFRGQIVTNGGNYYVCLIDGHSAFPSSGPTTTADAIPDNTTAWSYVGPTSGQNDVIADLTIGTTAPSDVILSSTSLTSGNPVVLPVPMDVQMPAL